jgi:guanylate kinase
MAAGKIIVFAAPSGTGKSTIAKRVLASLPNVQFSVSATTRAMREGEQDGREYFFLSHEMFAKKINDGDFIEYNQHFDNYYGTLKSEVDRNLNAGKNVLLDLDVNGAMNVKRLYGAQALLLFIKPPSLDALRERLTTRNTESDAMLQKRLERAEYELSFSEAFDRVVTNDALDHAVQEVAEILTEFISS